MEMSVGRFFQPQTGHDAAAQVRLKLSVRGGAAAEDAALERSWIHEMRRTSCLVLLVIRLHET